MNVLTNEVLMETYINAIQLNLEKQFILLIEEEINRRAAIPILCI